MTSKAPLVLCSGSFFLLCFYLAFVCSNLAVYHTVVVGPSIVASGPGFLSPPAQDHDEEDHLSGKIESSREENSAGGDWKRLYDFLQVGQTQSSDDRDLRPASNTENQDARFTTPGGQPTSPQRTRLGASPAGYLDALPFALLLLTGAGLAVVGKTERFAFLFALAGTALLCGGIATAAGILLQHYHTFPGSSKLTAATTLAAGRDIDTKSLSLLHVFAPPTSVAPLFGGRPHWNSILGTAPAAGIQDRHAAEHPPTEIFATPVFVLVLVLCVWVHELKTKNYSEKTRAAVFALPITCFSAACVFLRLHDFNAVAVAISVPWLLYESECVEEKVLAACHLCASGDAFCGFGEGVEKGVEYLPERCYYGRSVRPIAAPGVKRRRLQVVAAEQLLFPKEDEDDHDLLPGDLDELGMSRNSIDEKAHLLPSVHQGGTKNHPGTSSTGRQKRVVAMGSAHVRVPDGRRKEKQIIRSADGSRTSSNTALTSSFGGQVPSASCFTSATSGGAISRHSYHALPIPWRRHPHQPLGTGNANIHAYGRKSRTSAKYYKHQTMSEDRGGGGARSYNFRAGGRILGGFSSARKRGDDSDDSSLEQDTSRHLDLEDSTSYPRRSTQTLVSSPLSLEPGPSGSNAAVPDALQLHGKQGTRKSLEREHQCVAATITAKPTTHSDHVGAVAAVSAPSACVGSIATVTTAPMKLPRNSTVGPMSAETGTLDRVSSTSSLGRTQQHNQLQAVSEEEEDGGIDSLLASTHSLSAQRRISISSSTSNMGTIGGLSNYGNQNHGSSLALVQYSSAAYQDGTNYGASATTHAGVVGNPLNTFFAGGGGGKRSQGRDHVAESALSSTCPPPPTDARGGYDVGSLRRNTSIFHHDCRDRKADLRHAFNQFPQPLVQSSIQRSRSENLNMNIPRDGEDEDEFRRNFELRGIQNEYDDVGPERPPDSVHIPSEDHTIVVEDSTPKFGAFSPHSGLLASQQAESSTDSDPMSVFDTVVRREQERRQTLNEDTFLGGGGTF